jgi:hypothetical protein
METADQVQHGKRTVLKVCVRLERGRGPGKQSVQEIGDERHSVLTLEAGSDTGSNEKFSMRLA